MVEPGKAALEFESDTENLARVRQFMSEQMSKTALPAMEGNKVILAVDEACANIIKHAYDQEGRGRVHVVVEYDETRVEIRIHDEGMQFDPNQVKDVDIMEHVKKGRKTGLGIFLMRQIMDEVEYSFRDGQQNRLRMVKYVTPPGQEGEAGASGGKGA